MTIDWQMKRKKLDELMSVDKLTGWLKDQPPGGEYVYSDPVYCLMGKYLADHDVEWGAGAYSEMPSYYAIAAEKPWTFGAALERAKALSEETLSLPAPTLQIEAVPQEREMETIDATPADVRYLTSERHPAGDDGAAAASREDLR